jgi:Protein of unknown function (DUF3667)
MAVCPSCSRMINTRFCHECGAEAVVKRIDGKYIFQETKAVLLNFERGFFYTVKELAVRPGYLVTQFLSGDRRKLYKPISFVVISSILYTLVSHYLEYQIVSAKKDDNVSVIFLWITENYAYSNLIEILFLAITLNWFFKKKGYNYYENIIALCYFTGFSMLIGIVFVIFDSLVKTPMIDVIFPLIAIAYTIYALAHFYKQHSFLTYLKLLVAYLSGFLLFSLTAVLLGKVLEAFGIYL